MANTLEGEHATSLLYIGVSAKETNVIFLERLEVQTEQAFWCITPYRRHRSQKIQQIGDWIFNFCKERIREVL